MLQQRYSGCEDNKIDDGLEKQVTEKGKEMMQAWVDENMPGAELDEAAAAFWGSRRR